MEGELSCDPEVRGSCDAPRKHAIRRFPDQGVFRYPEMPRWIRALGIAASAPERSGSRRFRVDSRVELAHTEARSGTVFGNQGRIRQTLKPEYE
jgi:hypothetical protein